MMEEGEGQQAKDLKEGESNDQQSVLNNSGDIDSAEEQIVQSFLQLKEHGQSSRTRA